MPRSYWGSMNSMAIDRRRFLIGSLVTLGAARHALAAEGLADVRSAAVYASAARKPDGTYAVLILAENGNILREIPLLGRGHDVAIDHASDRAVVFARRPGYFAVAFDIEGKCAPEVFTPVKDRHFYGHGVFSRDGRLIYATEHDVETGDGVLGIYEVGSWRRIGEFPTYGVGPHEAILLADGKTLAIANGGFGSDPATGRENIDLAGMEPNMAFVDLTTGALRAKHGLSPDINMLSVRHLAANAAGEVWFGGQWQGGLEDSPELIGRASLDKPIAILEPLRPLGIALKGYIGSVAMSVDRRFLAASAPRAGRIVYTDTETGKIVREVAIDDGCGIAGSGGSEFAMSSGHGIVRFEHDGTSPPDERTFTGTEFDNHLRRV
jgi:hypothetical protein